MKKPTLKQQVKELQKQLKARTKQLDSVITNRDRALNEAQEWRDNCKAANERLAAKIVQLKAGFITIGKVTQAAVAE